MSDKAMSERPAIELHGVWKVYHAPQRLVAVQDVSVNIDDGRFVSIIGPSGCGKSTLLYMIHGLAEPSQGSVRVGGASVREPCDTADLNRALVFQDATLLPWKTVAENIGYGMRVGPRARNGIANDEIEERVAHYLKLTKLEGFEHYYPHQLSGGMKQRANLARALATHPELLLMDEPFSALDAQTREIMQEELLLIWEQESRTIVFITHDLEEALFLSDTIIIMGAHPGRIIEQLETRLPRPRDLSIKETNQFVKLRHRLWRLLETEIRKAIR